MPSLITNSVLVTVQIFFWHDAFKYILPILAACTSISFSTVIMNAICIPSMDTRLEYMIRGSSPDLGLKLGLIDYFTSYIFQKKPSFLFCPTDSASVSTAKCWRILNLNIIHVHHGGRFVDKPLYKRGSQPNRLSSNMENATACVTGMPIFYNGPCARARLK